MNKIPRLSIWDAFLKDIVELRGKGLKLTHIYDELAPRLPVPYRYHSLQKYIKKRGL